MIDNAPVHTYDVFSVTSFPHIVAWVVQEARAARYEALAGCGHSGLLVVGAACHVLGIPAIAVRKEEERSYGDDRAVNTVLDDAEVMSYAFVDDLISTGRTFTRVIDCIHGRLPELTCRGALFYHARATATDLRFAQIPGHDLIRIHNYEK